jgi:hypothetical protein
MEDAPAPVSRISSSLARSLLRAGIPGIAVLAIVFSCAEAVAAPKLNPFRAVRKLSQAEAAPPAAPAPPPAEAQGPRAGDVCRADDQCPGGTICERNVCTPVEPPIHALLFRKEGGATAFIPFYFHRRGNPGYRVIAPFYWHFWSPEGKTNIVAPFYWRFQDYLARRVVTVIPPYSHTIQPDAESWAIWPIFYRSTKFGWAAPLLLSFKIANPDEQRSMGLYALLYFWKRNREANTAFDLFFPFVVSNRSTDHNFTWFLPLNFYWRNGAGDKAHSNLLLLPLLYRNKNPEGATTISLLGYGHSRGRNSNGSIAWLYWYGRRADGGGYDLLLPLFYNSRRPTGSTLGSPLGYYSRDGENKRGAVAWLYWFGRQRVEGDQRKSYDVLFPFVWSFRSPQSSTTVLPPLFLHMRRPTYSFTTLFPLYWASRDPQKGSGWKVFFPLYFSRTGEEGQTFTWVTPLGGYRRDSVHNTRTLLLLPLYFHRRDPQREIDFVLPVFLRHRNPQDGTATTLLLNFYRRNDPQGSTTTFFPLFWHFRDAATGATAHTLLPFYFRRSGPEETLTAAGLFPLWGYYRNYREGGWSGGLFPLAFFGSRADKGHGVLFPLLWHFRNPRSTTTLAIPFYFRMADRRSTVAAIPPLLYFYGREGEGDRADRYHVQFPLFWRFTSGQTGTSTTVVPPLFYKSGKDGGWSGGLFPLLFAGNWPDRSHFVLFPLFWRFSDDKADRHSTLVLNYLHRRHGGETTDFLFPLVYWRRGAKPGAQPETSFTLFPLLHYKRTTDRRLIVSPIAFSSRSPERKSGFIPPYFWYQSKYTSASGVPPVYFDFTRLDTQERTRLYGPWVAIDSPKSRARILFPLFGRYRDDKDAGTWVFPSYFHRRTSDGYALDTLFPLFWHSRWPGNSTTVIGPWYRRAGPQKHNTGFVPLYIYARDESRRFILTPLFYERQNFKDGTGKLFAALLFYRTTRPDGHTTVAFPLYWGRRIGPRSYNVLFPLVWNFNDDEEKTSVTLAGPLYWSSNKDGKERTRGILPVTWYSRDDEQRTASHAFLPLFYEKHGPSQFTLLTLPFGFKNSPDRSWWYALNLFHRDTVQSTFTTFFPLWFSHFNKGTETSTRVIPPLLHFSRSRPDRALSGWLLLFWRHRDIDSSTTLGLPILYDIYNYHQNRLTLIAPVFFRYWRASDDTAYNFAPLFYRRSSPDSSTTVAFPLYWDFKGQVDGQERRTQVLFPLYIGVTRPTYTARFIFPSIYWRTGRGAEAGTSRFFLFPLYESAVKRPGDYMWEVALGLFGYERIGRNRYLKLLFFPFELQPAPAAQTAWYGKPVKRNRHVRRYGLDTRAW